ncbi:aspartate/glutamate racemase family protein [Paenibacillus flagellatus]|uniref:Aspartate racemase n=1 Tax=Paenibacillus flagellatus TaxID=2211139 RepID=A0A2V5KPA0_9BACL|nr:aspartate/glutamate racemase family protein [Paenibacillus flagellatus]PYI52977.1 aspartate racemase [Paenibacillus flagellatus]
MKTIGLIGGMSWESTAEYYRHLNTLVRNRLGGLHSAKCVLVSFDFAEMVDLQHRGEWEAAAEAMGDAARKLEAAGAEAVVICTNTMHKLADAVERAAGIPLLHIVDVTAEKIKERSLKTVGLLGTRFTMEQPFYRERLQRHGIRAVVPNEADRTTVHDVIYNELCQGVLRPESKAAYLDVIERLRAEGAEGIILGCTEIPLLLNEADTDLPLFDTTFLHAEAAIRFALETV